MSIALGVDIGGTKIAAGLVTEAGVLRCVNTRPTDAHRGGEHVLAQAVVAATSAIESAGCRPDAIGIGAGGRIDSESGIVLSATGILPGWAGIDIRRAFLPLAPRVEVDNDVNALACGEQRFGAARGRRTVAFLALGTGVGGALLLGGRVHHGAHFGCGEFGHMIVDISPGCRRGPGGEAGTLEAYCCGAGLIRTWRELGGEPAVDVDVRALAACAAAHPAGTAAIAIARTGEILGVGLASLANALDPEAIVIGGGISQLGESLLAPARRVLRERALPGPSQCEVLVASGGEFASVIGAACLAMEPQ